MTPTSFLEHWGILENPFRAEEARQDAVLARLVAAAGRFTGDNVNAPSGPTYALTGGASATANASGLAVVSPALSSRAQHNDYEKVVGDMRHPASSVVFGEKGSGKTTLRLQIQHAVGLHNAENPSEKVLLIAHDDLTAFLERLHARLVRQTRKGQTTPTDSFKLTRIVDHCDAILGGVVPRIVDQLIDAATSGNAVVSAAGAASGMTGGSEAWQLELGPEPLKAAKAFDHQTKRDLLLLQALYDRADGAGERARLLRRAVGVHRAWNEHAEWILTRFGWLLPVITLLYIYQVRRFATGRDYPDTSTGFLGWRAFFGLTETPDSASIAWATFLGASLFIWILLVIKRWWTHRILFNRIARRIYKQIRVTGRSELSFARSLSALPSGWRGGGTMPISDADATRLTMIQRLRRVLRPFGYSTLLIVVDRIDEPALMAGDVERMRAVVWPMLNNAFLQQEGVASKLLLPIELRHALMRESAAFFQQARMDKQNMVEQLSWTGAMLYDLCDARLAACRGAGVAPISLASLFDADVTRELLLESLEQMRQPRDAFKFLYACIGEHCARTVTAAVSEQAGDDPHAGYRVSRRVFEDVRKVQTERLRQLAMGIRPG